MPSPVRSMNLEIGVRPVDLREGTEAPKWLEAFVVGSLVEAGSGSTEIDHVELAAAGKVNELAAGKL